jgi:hypothetical protein
MYSVSNFGNVRNNRTGRILKQSVSKKGYLQVSLSSHSTVKKIKVHRMVSILFCDGDVSLEANHISGIKSNNRADNLEWISHVENLNHAFNTGLTTKKIKRVKCIESEIIYESSYSAGKENGISQGAISNACSGVRHTAGGYKWEWI